MGILQRKEATATAVRLRALIVRLEASISLTSVARGFIICDLNFALRQNFKEKR